MENAKIWISKSTSITETSAFPFAESVGAPSRKRTLNGKKLWHQACHCKIENKIPFALGNKDNVKLTILDLNL